MKYFLLICLFYASTGFANVNEDTTCTELISDVKSGDHEADLMYVIGNITGFRIYAMPAIVGHQIQDSVDDSEVTFTGMLGTLCKNNPNIPVKKIVAIINGIMIATFDKKYNQDHSVQITKIFELNNVYLENIKK